MDAQQPAVVALLAASALHAGFQATVTVLVYPVLAATDEERWAEVHARHSRRITPLVGLCYGALVAACAWVLVAGPRDPAVLVAVAGAAVAIGLTAAVAAPVHGRLGREGPRPDLLARLLRADRGRLAAAAVGLVAALVAAVAA